MHWIGCDGYAGYAGYYGYTGYDVDAGDAALYDNCCIELFLLEGHCSFHTLSRGLPCLPKNKVNLLLKTFF